MGLCVTIRAMVRTLDLSEWAGRWVALGADDLVQCDAASLPELLAAADDADLGEITVMRAPSPDDPVVFGLG